MSASATDASKAAAGSSSIIKPTDGTHVGPRGIFEGHEETVEDVQFCPSR